METRLVPRVPIHLKVLAMLDEKPEQSIELANGKYFEASAINISETGLCLIIKKYYLPRGTRVELVIAGELFKLKKKIKLKGETKYCKNYKGSTYKCGVKIIDISKEHTKAINSFIARQNKK